MLLFFCDFIIIASRSLIAAALISAFAGVARPEGVSIGLVIDRRSEMTHSNVFGIATPTIQQPTLASGGNFLSVRIISQNA